MGRDAAGRSSRRFRKLAADLRRQRRPCRVCGQPIDYDRSWPDPESFSVEHIKPYRTHPHLREDPGNLDAAHLGCNSSAGNRIRRDDELRQQIGQTSRRW